jgi:hypothetical protein
LRHCSRRSLPGLWLKPYGSDGPVFLSPNVLSCVCPIVQLVSKWETRLQCNSPNEIINLPKAWKHPSHSLRNSSIPGRTKMGSTWRGPGEVTSGIHETDLQWGTLNWTFAQGPAFLALCAFTLCHSAWPRSIRRGHCLSLSLKRYWRAGETWKLRGLWNRPLSTKSTVHLLEILHADCDKETNLILTVCIIH